MKKIILFLLLLPILSAAQTFGGMQAIQVKTASYGATQNALISLPDDYTSTAERYPLIIFLHGYGEIGNSVTQLSNLLKQGLPLVISKGGKIQAVNPLDGKLYKFIVISVQHHGWTTPAENIDFMVGDLPTKYRIDKDRIYLSGLSAGGQGVIQAVTYSQSLTSKLAAIVPMSPSAPDDKVLKNFTFFAVPKLDAWFFSGKYDPGNYTSNAKRYSDSINKYNPGGSSVYLYNGGHDGWANIYDPNFRVDGKSIYEWMLKNKRGVVNDTAVVPPKPTPDYQICVGMASQIKNIVVLMKDGTYRLYDSTSLSIPSVQISNP